MLRERHTACAAAPDSTWCRADISTLRQLSPDAAPEFIKHAALVAIPGKGRGLVATRDLPRHTAVILNPALVSASHDIRDSKSHTVTLSGKHMLTTAQSSLSSKAIQIACREPLAATMLLSLDDNVPQADRRREMPLVPLQVMQQQLSVRVLPLLPSTAEFFPASERVEVSAACVDRVCNVNSHGSGDLGDEATAGNLFPVVSLMNHSGDSNCDVMPLKLLRRMLRAVSRTGLASGGAGKGGREGQAVMAVITNRGVAAGEELTVRYHEDPDEVKRGWGL